MSLTIRWTSITLKGVNTYAITYFVLKCFFLKKNVFLSILYIGL